MKAHFAVLALLALSSFGEPIPAAAQPERPAAKGTGDCAPSMGLDFVCGMNQPEDLLQIGSSKWLLASGMGKGGGISLIDTAAKTARRLYTGQSKPDRKLYPDCATAPDVAVIDTHGLALRARPITGLYNLYAVTHGPFESIQVFALDARGPEPFLTWTGCVRLPADYRTNSVAATSDGTILANVQLKGTATNLDFINGRITGGVYEWKPSDKKLRLLPGTELAGNNGIELSKDEREFYIAVSGTQTVAVYSRADTSKPLRQVRTPFFNLDNIHWSGAPGNERLIAAGMMFDEPACGGTRKQIADAKGDLNCHRGWVAAQLDPVALQWTILAYGEPNPAFGGIATALVMGDTLWMGSFQMDRAAYRTLPSAPPVSTSCAPSMGLTYICGMKRPEDLLQIGASKYLVFGGSGASGGIGFIDSETKTWRQLDISRERPDRKLYPDCPTVPDIKTFNAHGIALRPAPSAGLYTLYTVTHAPFESIQIFALDARGEPSLTWTGCVKIPSDLRTNSVAAASDGTILANVQMKNGAIQADYMVGKITGGVFEWKPGDKSWRLLPGTELAGNNGIELSKDEKEFYVAVSGTQSVDIFSRADTSKPVRQARAIWFNIDNIHWSGDKLIATGVMYDEPACGGTRKAIVERLGRLNDCHRGWVAAQLDPASLQWTILSYGEAIADFGGASTGQIIGNTLWLSSNQMDRVGYRKIK